MTWTPWSGGRKREVDGQTTWYIRKRIGGARVEFAVATSEGAALAEWALFQSDPARYRPPKERIAKALQQGTSEGAVRLDGDTLAVFLKRCHALVKKGELSKGYVDGTLTPYLTAWGKALGERDLHTVTLDMLQDLLAAEEWQTAQHKRVVALKSFTSWAREEKPSPKLRRQGDPTLDLKTPAITPEKNRRKKGYSVAFVEKFYASIPVQAVRDLIRMRVGAHGLHDTETDRLAKGDGEIVQVDDPSGIAAVLVFPHKRGTDHSVPVDAATLAAAERLRARGAAPVNSFVHDVLHRTAIKMHGCAGVSRVMGHRKGERLGEPDSRIEPCPKCKRLVPSELRHSFATWAQTSGELVHAKGQRGVAVAAIAQALGHMNDGKTARTFYIGDHIPAMIRIPINLHHVDDP